MPPKEYDIIENNPINHYVEHIVHEMHNSFSCRQPRIAVRYAVIKDEKRVHLNWFLERDEIVYIHVAESAVNVYLHTGEVLKDVNVPLKEWVALDTVGLIQVHRKTIVNLKYVGGYRGCPDKGRYSVLFKTCAAEFEISDTYFKAFKTALEQF